MQRYIHELKWDSYICILGKTNQNQTHTCKIIHTKCNVILAKCKIYYTFKKRFYMEQPLLFPNKYKVIGWFILIPATISGIILSLSGFMDFAIELPVFAIISEDVMAERSIFAVIKTNVTNTIVGILFIVGAMLVAFSKEKNEDEFIFRLRLSSLVWAVWVNYGLLLLGFLFMFRLAFLHIMVYNMFTVLIIFIIRFNYMLYRNSKNGDDEK